MPSSKTLKTKNHTPHKFILYMAAATVIILVIYYVPNYFFLEKATADGTAFLLSSLGISVQTKVLSENVYLANIQIVKDCTGIQVIAVFFGLLIPLPDAQLKKKLVTIVVVSALLFAANVLRIALEFSLVHLNILPWFWAHYPLSLLLGVVGMLILLLVADRLLPEFGDYLFNIAR